MRQNRDRMEFKEHIPLLEDILTEYRSDIGDDFHAYKNHLYRIINFCFLLKHDIEDEQEKKLSLLPVSTI